MPKIPKKMTQKDAFQCLYGQWKQAFDKARSIVMKSRPKSKPQAPLSPLDHMIEHKKRLEDAKKGIFY
jgi:hypothetical protein